MAAKYGGDLLGLLMEVRIGVAMYDVVKLGEVPSEELQERRRAILAILNDRHAAVVFIDPRL